jgi:hypothetical protein
MIILKTDGNEVICEVVKWTGLDVYRLQSLDFVITAMSLGVT